MKKCWTQTNKITLSGPNQTSLKLNLADTSTLWLIWPLSVSFLALWGTCLLCASLVHPAAHLPGPPPKDGLLPFISVTVPRGGRRGSGAGRWGAVRGGVPARTECLPLRSEPDGEGWAPSPRCHRGGNRFREGATCLKSGHSEVRAWIWCPSWAQPAGCQPRVTGSEATSAPWLCQPSGGPAKYTRLTSSAARLLGLFANCI